MKYLIRHYELAEPRAGYFERQHSTIHGEEFGGEAEQFDDEEQAIADFRQWLLESGYDAVTLEPDFAGWGVVYRCQQEDATRLISADILPIND
jgi:hypothetical protein